MPWHGIALFPLMISRFTPEDHYLLILRWQFDNYFILFLISICFLVFAMFFEGHLPLTFRTPPVSPPRHPSYLTGMRRVYSWEFRSSTMNPPDSGLADPLLGPGASSGVSDRSFLPQSTIYNWSCGYFSKPILTGDDTEELSNKREEKHRYALDQIAKCQHLCEFSSMYSGV